MLRKACEGLPPAEVVWRKKAQFDEGSGTVRALEQVLAETIGSSGPVDRAREGELYEEVVRERYKDPRLILDNAGTRSAERIAAYQGSCAGPRRVDRAGPEADRFGT